MAPPGIEARNTRERWALVTAEQKREMERVHIYAEHSWLKKERYPFNPGYRKMRLAGLKTVIFIVTVRWGESDWSRSDRSDGDGVNVSHYEDQWRGWFSTFGGRMEEMVMELETTEERKDELESVVEGWRGWKLGPLENRFLRQVECR